MDQVTLRLMIRLCGRSAVTPLRDGNVFHADAIGSMDQRTSCLHRIAEDLTIIARLMDARHH